MAKQTTLSKANDRKPNTKPNTKRSERLKKKAKSPYKKAEETRQFFLVLMVGTVLLCLFLFFIMTGKK
jgi:uncharacterized integral membrane protein